MASKCFYISSLTLEAPVPFSPAPVAVSRPCLSLPVLLPDLLYKSFIKCHKLRFFGGCPYSREKKETRTKKKSSGTPPPPRSASLASAWVVFKEGPVGDGERDWHFLLGVALKTEAALRAGTLQIPLVSWVEGQA